MWEIETRTYSWCELSELAHPVGYGGEWGSNQKRPLHAHLNHVRYHRDALDGLAQSHLIGKDPIHTVLIQHLYIQEREEISSWSIYRNIVDLQTVRFSSKVLWSHSRIDDRIVTTLQYGTTFPFNLGFIRLDKICTASTCHILICRLLQYTCLNISHVCMWLAYDVRMVTYFDPLHAIQLVRPHDTSC